MASTLLAVALMGAVSGMISGLNVAITAKENNRANDAALSVVENFWNSCSADFNAALATFDGQTTTTGNITVATEVILDETRFNPPVDLNGDGDVLDTSLTPTEVNAAYIETTVTWGTTEASSASFVALVARSEVGNSTSTPGPVTPTSPTSPTSPSSSGLITLNSSEILEQEIRMGVEVPGSPINIVGITITGTNSDYIKEIKVGGIRVFNEPHNALPIGSLVPVTPFTLEAGSTNVDKIKFSTTSDGGRADIRGHSFVVTFHHESGGSTSFPIE